MEISQYYNLAKQIGNLPELKDTKISASILSALDYDRMNDHPSCWVPNVQPALLKCFKRYPNELFSSQVIELYTKGEIMQDLALKNYTVKAGVACLIIGFIIGWIL